MGSSDDPTPTSSPEAKADAKGNEKSARRGRVTLAILGMLLGWTYLYNILVKEQGLLQAFFEVLDTISDDFVMGSIVTFAVGGAIVVVFTVTKLYTQIIADAYSFRTLEDLVVNQLVKGNVRGFFKSLLSFEDLPQPDTVYPRYARTVPVAFALLYALSWVYIILFSEALFFVSWSAGVDLPVTEDNLLLMPTLALAIPFSARVMAYLRYPYAQDYADFMPGAVFVLLLVASLGFIFGSDDQKWFLVQVWETNATLQPFVRNGAFLAFIPVFVEAMVWVGMLYGGDGSKSTE